MPVYYGTAASTATATTTGWITMTTTATSTATATTVWYTDATGMFWQSPAEQWAAQVRRTDRLIAEYEAANEAAWREAELQRMARAQARDLARRHSEAAKYRARELLLEHLTPEQRSTFTKNDWFVVEGGKSKTKYRIRAKGSLVANIDVLAAIGRAGDLKVTHRLCGHCDPHAVPLHDHLLAQKMMLEYAEDDFLKIANRHAA